MTKSIYEIGRRPDAAQLLHKLIHEIGATDLQEPPKHGEPEPWFFGVNEEGTTYINIKLPENDYIIVAAFDSETGAYLFAGTREVLTSPYGVLH